MLDNGYGVLPNKVLFDKQLSSTSKLLFCYISSLCASRGYCFASNEHMASKFDVSTSQISRLIGTLSAYIEIQNGGNEKRTIRLRKNAYVPTQKPQTSLRKNAEHNNTSTNSISRIEAPIVPKQVVDAEAIKLAWLLGTKVKENFSFTKLDDKLLNTWAKDIDKLHRVDGYDWQTIRAVVDWSQDDDFWKQNIRSGAKLRKQFESLLVRIKSTPKRMEIIS